jgi:D-alanine-D-alanine ligase-like ATP-grasp enzyme
MTPFTESFKLLVDYLEQNQYRVSSLKLTDKYDSFVAIDSTTKSGRLIINSKSPTYPFVTTSSRRILRNKSLSYALAESFDITIPSTIVAMNYSKELELFLETHQRLIVKPNNGQGSHGLTLNIETVEQLKKAVDSALLHSNQVLVQRQFIGEEVRFTAFDGKVRSAMLRQKPYVTGDGSSTVADLIEAENKARALLTFTSVQYPQLDENFISAELIHSKYVPEDKEKVELGLGTMIRNGASIYDVMNTIDHSYIKIVEKIASAFGKGMVALDMMISDIHTVADKDNYIFLEMNNDPSLILYYSCRDGNNFDIVNDYLGPMIIDAIEGSAR